MYEFVSHTLNPIKGKCSHDCKYCNLKAFPQTELRIVEKELKTDLGKGNFIFVGSGTDMFANDVPHTWIYSVLNICNKYPDNRYMFQTKNPVKFIHFKDYFPKNTVLCTTIETNRNYYFDIPYNVSKAPQDVMDRAKSMGCNSLINFEKSVTIEPIMDFDLNELAELIKPIKPSWISIGADSKEHNLPEPTWGKIKLLIMELGKFTRVIIKPNLYRLKDR